MSAFHAKSGQFWSILSETLGKSGSPRLFYEVSALFWRTFRHSFGVSAGYWVQACVLIPLGSPTGGLKVSYVHAPSGPRAWRCMFITGPGCLAGLTGRVYRVGIPGWVLPGYSPPTNHWYCQGPTHAQNVYIWVPERVHMGPTGPFTGFDSGYLPRPTDGRFGSRKA